MRRASFLLALAYATELAIGQPEDFALRSCVLAMRVSRLAGHGAELRRQVFHLSLLRYIGCNADSHLMTRAVGDEIEFRRDFARVDFANPVQLAGIVAAALRRAMPEAEETTIAQAVQQALADVLPQAVPILAGHCEVAARIGARLGLDAGTVASLSQIYERWDGKGLPNGLMGAAVHPAVRVVSLAQDIVIHQRSASSDEIVAQVQARRGGMYEPALADLFCANAAVLLQGNDAVDEATVLALEPEPAAEMDGESRRQAFEAMADFVDMRMPYSTGHARRVAGLCDGAAIAQRLPQLDREALWCAALAHDVGELIISVDKWLHEGQWTKQQRDRAQLHPYHSERMLAVLGTDAAAIARLVGSHHENLDGSGYHRGLKAAQLSPASRILAAAEAYQTLVEDRPHRAALSPRQAAAQLQTSVAQGRFDASAVAAVLNAAGNPPRRQLARGPSLTPREGDVLRLLVSGQTVKEVAQTLSVAPKTADNHVQSLYAKLGVRTRAAAVLWAVENGLTMQARD
jgi:HD-GYP domain-containing protein (c-di-GMP phosphodiesterase class II)